MTEPLRPVIEADVRARLSSLLAGEWDGPEPARPRLDDPTWLVRIETHPDGRVGGVGHGLLGAKGHLARMTLREVATLALDSLGQ
jgi:hypothetical protein